MSFIYSLESIKLAEIYATKGLDALLANKSTTRTNLVKYLEDTMVNSQTSAIWREAVTAKVLGHVHLTRLHGPDAITINNQNVEIKTESTTLRSDKNNSLRKLMGTGVFGHYHKVQDLEKLKNQLFILCGFHEGKFVYAISFTMNGKFEEMLTQRIETKSKNTGFKFSYTDWQEQPDLKLVYLCKDLSVLKISNMNEIIGTGLLNVINKLLLIDSINNTLNDIKCDL